MGRKSGRRPTGGARTMRKKTLLDSGDELENEEEPDPKSRSYIYDEIDEFHANHEKELLNAGIQYEDTDQSEEEEVLGLSLSEDDDDDDNNGTVKYDFAANHKVKDDMASDLEDENDLPDIKAWGKQKSTYYSTDYVDKAYIDYKESDEELADAEEKEAKAIQERMANQLDDVDFGLDLFKVHAKTVDNKKVQKIEKDFSQLSKQERLEILKRESPEFLGLVNDFKDKLLEIKDRTEPLFNLVKEGKIPAGPGADYISIRHQLLLNYCTNLCFYLAMKAKRAPLAHHPIIKRLLEYVKLIKELEPLETKLADEINGVLQFLKDGKDVAQYGSFIRPQVPTRKRTVSFLENHDLKPIKSNGKETKRKESLEALKKPKNLLVISRKRKEELQKSDTMVKKIPRLETKDEREALRLYDMMKSRLKAMKTKGVLDKEHEMMESAESVDEQEEDSSEEEENIAAEKGNKDESEDTTEKRAITYQIAKNKGLTPYRKKANRNVRVKNRLKYRKAKIRRKGQVQEVRKEIAKYGGEISGIKATSSRSIKLK